MSTLRWVNIGLLLLGLTLFVILGVVCILYAFYLDEAPRLRDDWPQLIRSTLLFGVLALVATLGEYGLRKQTSWRWAGQGALAATVLVVGILLKRLLIGV